MWSRLVGAKKGLGRQNRSAGKINCSTENPKVGLWRGCCTSHIGYGLCLSSPICGDDLH